MSINQAELILNDSSFVYGGYASSGEFIICDNGPSCLSSLPRICVNTSEEGHKGDLTDVESI